MEKKSSNNPKRSKDNIKNSIIKWFWILFCGGIVLITLLFVMIAKGYIGYMPPIEDLENPINKYASQIISSDMKPLGTYSLQRENRIYVNYKDLSPDLINALVATEDARFRDHSGIDAYALVRAVIKRGFLRQKNAGGASTISQQLAKQLYTEHAKSTIERLFQKPVEWVIAIQLERYYTKEEIINMYLNKFDFLYNAVGIQSACWAYFGKQPNTVTTEEAATLIGMCKNPSYYNPMRRVERTTGRRNMVLSLMEKNGYIAKTVCDSLQKLPLVTNFNRVDHKDGLAPHFRENLRLIMTAKKPERKNYRGWQDQEFKEDSIAWLNDPLFGWCTKNNYDLYTDGLIIYTTIDSRMQLYAEQAVKEHMGGYLQDLFFKEKKNSKTAPFSRDLTLNEVSGILTQSMKQSDRYKALIRENKSETEIENIFNMPVEMTVFSWKGLKDTIMSPMDSIRYMKSFLRTGFLSMDANSGAVKAYVGDINYAYFKYDMVTMSKRQVGSTIKPFLYSLAMESGFTPCDETLHVEQTIITETGEPWTPRNSTTERIGERVTLNWGLQKSSNWISAYLMKQLSPYAFAQMLNSFGLQGPIDPVYALSLGVCNASVEEMVTGYSTFANRGMRVKPMYVTRIEDNYGNVLASFTPQIEEIISESAAAKMLSMLQNVIDGGTGSRMRIRHALTVPMGGKTGTTQNHSDGWFMCFTPSLVTGCWVGGDNRGIHFDRLTEGQGAAMALPIAGIFMKKVYSNKELGYFETEAFEVSEAYLNPCKTREDEEEETSSSAPTRMIDEFFD